MSAHCAISISIVSHQQGELVKELLHDLQAYCSTPLEVILTINVPEILPFDVSKFRFPIHLVKNDRAHGFSTNHNAAFHFARAAHFCILNPDIRIEQDPFPALLALLSNPTIGACAPLILNPAGTIEESVRKYPTPLSILLKLLAAGSPRADYRIGEVVIFPDWIAGMFMVIRADLYKLIGGFDERYFLYYEDVDICWRLRRRGYDIALQPSAQAIHLARRASHRNLRYLAWHLKSMLRFFVKRFFYSIGS